MNHEEVIKELKKILKDYSGPCGQSQDAIERLEKKKRAIKFAINLLTLNLCASLDPVEYTNTLKDLDQNQESSNSPEREVIKQKFCPHCSVARGFAPR